MIRLSPDKSRFEYVQPSCHSRLNMFGEMSLSNRYQVRNKRMNQSIDDSKTGRANRYGVSNTSNTRKGHQQRHKKIDQSKNPEHDPTHEISPKVQAIRRLGLLGGLNLKQVRYQGHIRIPTVHNDYHASTSNPGYSRKPDGGIYPK